jgi:hypothetical protein
LGVLTLVAFNFQSAEPKIDTWKDFEAFEDEDSHVIFEPFRDLGK